MLYDSEKTAKFSEENSSEDGSAVMTLTANNFENGLQTGFVFVKFFAPWFVCLCNYYLICLDKKKLR